MTNTTERQQPCDFCATAPPTFLLPTRTFPAPTYPFRTVDDFQGDWSACTACANLIRKDQWAALLARVVTLTQRRAGRTIEGHERLIYAAVFRRLVDNITGPLRPITPPSGTCE